ncbi:MAG: UDP-3-O-acyl-N-acetylglucosamine deacetylase [Planctomycetota bacterium]|nr:UDP-3-O-acyl-N-acetylglucosamine deacetylase [Planctomycetota bacterium]
METRTVESGSDEQYDSSTRSTKQHTLQTSITVAGPGLMHGHEAIVTIDPAPPGHGIVFERVDLDPPVRIPALVTHAVDRDRRTALKNGEGMVETVEHCMSALAGFEIDNALIRINGPEMPLGDGSALPWIEPMREVGRVEQDSDRRLFRVTQPIVIEENGSVLAAFPTDRRMMQLLYELDYGANSDRISRQACSFSLGVDDYLSELSPARTYSLKEEAQALWDQGYCRHLSPKEVLVIGADGPIENELRFHNEPVRHKVLDMLGDLYLVGGEIQGRFVASRSGHSLNRRMCELIIEQDRVLQSENPGQERAAMDIRTIRRIMPHRYPMLLVDRVLEIDGDRRAVGVKNVSINEPFFEGHYPDTPIMPGVLLVEAMAQLGGLLLSQKLEHTGKIAVLLSLDRVKLRHPVTPGDQVVLEAETIRASSRTASIRGTASVGGKLAAEANIRFMMVDGDQE